MDELNSLITEANKVFTHNFANETWFERALFFSWSCAIKDCGFCYMSTQEKRNKNDDDRSVRSKESIYAETIICKHLGWKIGFFSGGINAYKQDDIIEMLSVIYEIIGEKVWINLGPVPEPILKKYLPYIKGVVGSVETVNEEIHKIVCPSKPIAPYVKMFQAAKKLGLKNSMTLILGLGETKHDIEQLKIFIEENDIKKIHVYALNPVPDTMFENHNSPSDEYHAWYIANIRIAFPKMDIQMGIWTDKLDRISLLLKAGANSISKFPVIRKFGSEEAEIIEKQAISADRKFLGSLTVLPNIDWDVEVDKLSLNKDIKERIKFKLNNYIKKMSSNVQVLEQKI